MSNLYLSDALAEKCMARVKMGQKVTLTVSGKVVEMSSRSDMAEVFARGDTPKKKSREKMRHTVSIEVDGISGK